jgi:hypothetical protein
MDFMVVVLLDLIYPRIYNYVKRYCYWPGHLLPCRAMSAKEPAREPGTWIFKAIPRDLMRRAKMGAAAEETTVKDMILKLVEGHLAELEKKGLLPKGK